LGQRSLHVIDLYVQERVRKTGIATALMRRAAEVGRSRGAKFMVWSVYTRNSMARAFYERLGARPVKDLDFLVLRI